MQDDNTIESYKIEEKGFIVCMTSKVSLLKLYGSEHTPILLQPKAAPSKPAALPSTPAQPPSVAATPAAPQASSQQADVAPPATPTPAPASTAAVSDSSNFNDPSALALGDQRAAAIQNMEAMGFPRSDIDRAMRAAFFNPDRAVEYLLTGIPESAQREERPAAASPPPTAGGNAPAATGNQGAQPATGGEDEPMNLFEAAAAAGRGGAGGRGAAGAGAAPGGGAGAGAGAGAGGNTGAAAPNLEFLRTNPQFQQLRQVVQQQPQMLEPILQQVAAGNPQLAQIIAQHPDQFMQLLAEDADDDVALPPGAQQISVTEEEREAIERVCMLCVLVFECITDMFV